MNDTFKEFSLVGIGKDNLSHLGPVHFPRLVKNTFAKLSDDFLESFRSRQNDKTRRLIRINDNKAA